jgi:hypothetical protein
MPALLHPRFMVMFPVLFNLICAVWLQLVEELLWLHLARLLLLLGWVLPLYLFSCLRTVSCLKVYQQNAAISRLLLHTHTHSGKQLLEIA